MSLLAMLTDTICSQQVLFLVSNSLCITVIKRHNDAICLAVEYCGHDNIYFHLQYNNKLKVCTITACSLGIGQYITKSTHYFSNNFPLKVHCSRLKQMTVVSQTSSMYKLSLRTLIFLFKFHKAGQDKFVSRASSANDSFTLTALMEYKSLLFMSCKSSDR